MFECCMESSRTSSSGLFPGTAPKMFHKKEKRSENFHIVELNRQKSSIWLIKYGISDMVEWEQVWFSGETVAKKHKGKF